MSHDHVTVAERDGGLGTGMVLGVVLALLVLVLAAFFYFGGFSAAGTTDEGSGDGGAGTSGTEGAPSSYQYLVPDYQVAVR